MDKIKTVITKAKSKVSSVIKRKPRIKKEKVSEKAVAINTLLGQKMVPVRVVTTKYKTPYGEGTLPKKELMISSLTSYSKDFVLMYYYKNGLNYRPYIYAPTDFMVEVLQGDEAAAVTEEVEKMIIENLHINLTHAFYIGTDPEIFVEDKTTGKVIPAFDFLGSKTEPSKYTDRYSQKNLYWDGFQAEFDTTAAMCLAYHCDCVQMALKELKKKAIAHNPNAILSIKTTMDIDAELLGTAKDEHVEFGCMPSKNAYGMKGLEAHGREVPFRSAGGHIHFGIGKKTEEEYVQIVKALDAILGVVCVSLFAKLDDPRRRKLYGLAGEYRTPAHGLEYRVLSNAWICHPAIKNLVFDLSRKVVVFGQRGLMKYWKADEKETIECINNYDVKKAHEIMERNKDILLKIFCAAYHLGDNTKSAETSFRIFKEGVEAAIKDPTDISGNWMLDKGWVDHCNAPGKSWSAASKIINKGEKVG